MSNFENNLDLLGAESRSFIGRRHGLAIGGKSVSTQRTYSVVDPTSGSPIAAVANASADDVAVAVESAKKAFRGEWAALRPNQRERLLLKLADLFEQHARELSEIETVNTGRLLANTLGVDVGYSATVLRYMAGWATKIEGQTTSLSIPFLPTGEFLGLTFREPVGVVAAIVPWNVPLGIAVWKLAPALAAGCTMVLKPAPQTPLTALRLAELVLEAGIPEGVFNVVTGEGADVGTALTRHPDVAMISFTGSSGVGRQVAMEAAGAFKKCSLELGGKSPVIIMEDADLDWAIPSAAWAIFANHGQNCCAGSRLYVHERLFRTVIDGVIDIATSIRLGSPLDPNTTMGPLINSAHQQRVLGYIESGRREGARVVTGGGRPDHPGAYVEPTVLVDVEPHMTPVREEIFGPVLVAAPFKSEEEAVRLANDSDFGLGASVFTRDLDRVRRMTKSLQAGSVWVNVHNALDVALPFGGWKNSGLGFDLSEQAVLAHTKLKASVQRYG